MKNMKQKLNKKVREKIAQVAVNAGEQVIEGKFCIGWWYEPKIPQKLLKITRKQK